MSPENLDGNQLSAHFPRGSLYIYIYIYFRYVPTKLIKGYGKVGGARGSGLLIVLALRSAGSPPDITRSAMGSQDLCIFLSFELLPV